MGVILRRETAANRVEAAIGLHRAARVARKGHNKTGLAMAMQASWKRRPRLMTNE
jgi:hypothetical protein